MNRAQICLEARRTGEQRGFSLIELMVAMVLSIILLAGVIEVYTGSKQAFYVQEGISRMQEGGRFVMDRLSKDIGAAGYMGCLASAGNVINTLSTTTGIYNLAAPITGEEGTGPMGTDKITISRAVPGAAIPVVQPMNNQTSSVTVDDTEPGYDALEQGDVIILSDCSDAVAFMVTSSPVANDGGVIQHDITTAAPSGHPNAGLTNQTTDLQHVYGSDNGSLASVIPVVTKTYEIATSTAGGLAGGVCSAATPGYCALRETSNAGAREMVEGVEDLQILYGEDTDVTPDLVPDVYRAANNVADWNDVVSVRIIVSVNEVEQAQGRGDGVVDPNLGKTFSNVIRLRSRGT